MRIAFDMALQTKKQEAEQPELAQAEEEKVEKHFNVQREAKKQVEKDLVNQKDRLQQRLAERKRSKAMRATSQINN